MEETNPSRLDGLNSVPDAEQLIQQNPIIISRENQKKFSWKRFLINTLLSIVSVVALGMGIILYLAFKKDVYNHNYKAEIELNHWKYKSAVVDAMQGFMDSKVKTHNISALVMLNACDEYNIDPRLPLCQGLLESHYGTTGLARHTNSVFNMGAYDGRPLDQISGRWKYAHPNQSIDPYLKKLRKTYLGHSKTEEDLLKNFVNLSNKRYATYEKYEQDLLLIWNEINATTDLDSLIRNYQYSKVELGR